MPEKSLETQPPVPPPRRWLSASSLLYLYLGCLLLLWVFSGTAGERNPAVAFLLYVPPVLWLLPVFPLLLFRAVRHRRPLLMLAAAAAIHLVWHMNWRLSFSSRPGPEEETVCIVTYNRGEEGRVGMSGFVKEVRPDIILVQDAKGRARHYKKDAVFADYPHFQDVGEFTILSKFPVLSARLVGQTTAPPEGEAPLAARFELDVRGRPAVIYSVHLMTPRRELQYYMRGAVLYGILGLVPGTPFADKKDKLQKFWDARIADAEFLLGEIRREPLPCMAAGDFNMIDRGWIYRQFAAEMTDAHREKGRGWGCTVPGGAGLSLNPLSLIRPWMRLDYVWAGKGWSVRHCEAESGRGSQHLALAAWLKLDSIASAP